MKINLLLAAALAALFIWNPYPFQLLELKTLDSLIMSREEVQDRINSSAGVCASCTDAKNSISCSSIIMPPSSGELIVTTGGRDTFSIELILDLQAKSVRRSIVPSE